MKTKKTIQFLMGILFLIPFSIFSQGEGSNWFFGCSSGISFDMSNNNQPASILGALPMQSREGVSSVSNADGTLLFYTDGRRVYDQNHVASPVQLLGDASSTQSGVAFADPSAPDQYYVFTADVASGNQGINYYRVNTNGGVITVDPTANLLDLNLGYTGPKPNYGHSEKITAVKKCSGKGYWVLTMNSNGDYLVYDVSVTGVAFNSLYQSNTPLDPVRYKVGYLKYSPDGTLIANVMSSGNVDIYSFDNTTGIITGDPAGNAPLVRLTALPLQMNEPYGGEFSADSRFLYVSCLGVGNNPPQIVRYDLLNMAANPPSVATSQQSVFNAGANPNFVMGALQMGLDGQIYIAKEGRYANAYLNVCDAQNRQLSLGVIANPSELVLANVGCNIAGFPLANGSSKIGLPNFPADFFYSIVKVENPVCPQVTGTATASPFSHCGGPYRFEWRKEGNFLFADNNIANNVSITKSGLAPGNYSIKISNLAGGSETQNFVVAAPDFENCCPALRGVKAEHLTIFSQNTTLTMDEMWEDKIYIADGVIVTVDGATLDITNVDVIFGECAGIDFVNGAVVRANNSVFRPCDPNGKWRGTRFILDGIAASGMFNECTFKNANKAIEVNYLAANKNDISLRISNNLFANCQNGVYLRMNGGVFTRGITGNSFIVEAEAPAFRNANACYTDINNDSRHYGVFANGVFFDDIIGENDFITTNLANRFVGIYVLNSDRAKIINNNHDNNWVSIYLVSTDGAVIESNEVNVGSIYKTYTSQVIAHSSNYIRIVNNSIYNSSTNNSIGLGRSAKSAIYLKGSSIANIKENKITSFETGIDLREVRNSNISENNIDNCWRYGIYMDSPFDLDIACNYIKMEYNDLNNSPIGIAAYFPVWDNLANGSISNPTLAEQTKIKGNCILESKEAIHIENNAANKTNTPVAPTIVNNYLYNYVSNGVYLSNMNTSRVLGTGLTQQTAGRNTFTSNNIAGGALDINAIGAAGAPVVKSNGNYGVSTVSTNVQISGNNMYNSTASCANQIGVVNNQINDDQICDQLTGNEKLFEVPVKSNLEVSSNIEPYFEPTSVISEAVNVTESHFEMFPNPARNEVKMTLNSESEEDMQILIYSIDGKLLKTYNLSGHNIQASFDVSDLIEGLYFVQLKDAQRIIDQQKLVVIK